MKNQCCYKKVIFAIEEVWIQLKIFHNETEPRSRGLYNMIEVCSGDYR